MSALTELDLKLKLEQCILLNLSEIRIVVAEIERLEAELEGHVWDMTPAMYEARIEQLQKELAAKPAEKVWQPIETAPKDGTEILGRSEDGIRCVIRWSKHNHVPIYGFVRQIELYGEEVDGFDAIHWMPLPDDPDCGGKIEIEL